LADAVEIALAFRVLSFATLSYELPGSTSKGPPAAPVSVTPPTKSTPEKAIIAPEPSSASASNVKEKFVAATSVALATLYRRVPHHSSFDPPPPVSPVLPPAINVHPVRVAFDKVALSLSLCTIFANITSPTASPEGFVMVSVVFVVILD
jgi:hypothetical protein